MRKLLYMGLVMAAFLLVPVVHAAPDFSINAAPRFLTISAGNSGSSTITLSSTGFAGTVLLSATINPNDPTIGITLNPTSVDLSKGGSGNSILTVTTTPFTPLATYTVTVTGTSGSISHPITVGVTVVSGTVGGVAVRDQSVGFTPLGLGMIAFGGVASVCIYFSGVKIFSAKRHRD